MATATRIKFGDYLNVTDEGDGVIRVDGCACDCGDDTATATPVFALTGGPFAITTSPVILDTPASGVMSLYTSNPTIFDSSSGRARILGPGMYVIVCQINPRTIATLSSDLYVYLHLSYAGDIGYSVEIPWLESGFLVGTAGEEVAGTRFVFPNGATSGWDVALQRMHPISLTSSTTFPLEIQPKLVTNGGGSGDLQVGWMALWGWRLGDPLDAYHS